MVTKNIYIKMTVSLKDQVYDNRQNIAIMSATSQIMSKDVNQIKIDIKSLNKKIDDLPEKINEQIDKKIKESVKPIATIVYTIMSTIALSVLAAIMNTVLK